MRDSRWQELAAGGACVSGVCPREAERRPGARKGAGSERGVHPRSEVKSLRDAMTSGDAYSTRFAILETVMPFLDVKSKNGLRRDSVQG